MNVCIKYWIDKEYTDDLYLKNIIKIIKNDKSRFIAFENHYGKKYIFRDSLVDSVIIGANVDYEERGDKYDYR